MFGWGHFLVFVIGYEHYRSRRTSHVYYISPIFYGKRKEYYAKMSQQERVAGFNVVPVKFSAESKSCHHFFVKQHSLREKTVEKPPERTLFVLNVPSYCTEDAMKFAWSVCGPVERVYFHDKPNAGVPPADRSLIFPALKPTTGIKVAYVVFEKSKGLQQALSHPSKTPLILSGGSCEVLTGINKWISEYESSIVNEKEMEAEIESYMASYDAEEEERKSRGKKDAEEDADGWITVTKGGRHPGFARKEHVTRKIQTLEEKKRSKKELLNFYSFQLRESKIKNLLTLRKKFEEDKKKIAAFKQTRKFKPF